jgi:hypothetical protein
VVNQHPWNKLPALGAISPNLVIFQAGIINDWDDAVPLSTVTANMTAVINASAMYDSLHPNQVGYGLIADYAKAAVLNPTACSLS